MERRPTPTPSTTRETDTGSPLPPTTADMNSLNATDIKALDALDEHFVTHWDPTRSP